MQGLSELIHLSYYLFNFHNIHSNKYKETKTNHNTTRFSLFLRGVIEKQE
ncbi:hypothetical protein Hanom_Chr06g00496481 [Helianthus anomalus]